MDSYNNSVDALRRLLSTDQSSYYQDVLHMTNGIEYCAVEITRDDGTQYGIEAYGEEAIKLHKEALRHYMLEKEGSKEMPLVYNISYQ
jgi:hypothetical protein